MAQTKRKPAIRRKTRAPSRKGMKLLRLWVPDPKAPGFAAEARRQAALLRDAPEERDALDFIEKAADFGPR
ncbi:MAG: antitoxin MazE-like protein [Tagaea sp.]